MKNRRQRNSAQRCARAGLWRGAPREPCAALREHCASIEPHCNALWRSLKALRFVAHGSDVFLLILFRAVARDELVLLPKAANNYLRKKRHLNRDQTQGELYFAQGSREARARLEHRARKARARLARGSAEERRGAPREPCASLARAPRRGKGLRSPLCDLGEERAWQKCSSLGGEREIVVVNFLQWGCRPLRERDRHRRTRRTPRAVRPIQALYSSRQRP